MHCVDDDVASLPSMAEVSPAGDSDELAEG